MKLLKRLIFNIFEKGLILSHWLESGFKGSEREDILFRSDDFLKIVNENNEPFGVCCGREADKTVIVTGSSVVMTFHSNSVVQERGFFLLFTAFHPSEYNHDLILYHQNIQRISYLD